MNGQNRRWMSWIVGFTALVVACLTVSAPADGSGRQVHFALVVAKSSSLTDLSLHELRRIYSGEHVGAPGGGRMIPLGYPAGTRDRVAFDRKLLDMTPDEVARYWINRKIRGETGPPKAVGSSSLLQRVVARLGGSIGYVRASEVSGAVKVLRINGKLPSDQGYELLR